MFSAIDTAFSGLSASQTRLDVSANNVANINTDGFKASRALQEDAAGGGTQISQIQTDFSQGGLRSTGVPTDQAIAPFGGSTRVLSGFLETSNTDLVSETVNQILAQRAFEFNLNTLRTADEMTGTLLDLVS